MTRSGCGLLLPRVRRMSQNQHAPLNFEAIWVAARNASEHIAPLSPNSEADVAFVREWLVHALVLTAIAALVAITVLH